MASHETVSCPRCNTAFECRVGSILRCQCQQVPLTEDERFYIRENYTGCLCANCLQEIQATYKQRNWWQRLQQIFLLSSKR